MTRRKSSKRQKVFDGQWWTVALPEGWYAARDKHGATFCRKPRLGTLQISAARKHAGRVRDEDVRDFAADAEGKSPNLRSVRYKAFTGYHSSVLQDALVLHKWWLKEGSLLLYVTYVVPELQQEPAEFNQVQSILESLASPRGVGE